MKERKKGKERREKERTIEKREEKIPRKRSKGNKNGIHTVGLLRKLPGEDRRLLLSSQSAAGPPPVAMGAGEATTPPPCGGR